MIKVEKSKAKIICFFPDFWYTVIWQCDRNFVLLLADLYSSTVQLNSNVCSAENLTKRSSNTLLRLVRFSAEQTLKFAQPYSHFAEEHNFLHRVIQHFARKPEGQQMIWTLKKKQMDSPMTLANDSNSQKKYL